MIPLPDKTRVLLPFRDTMSIDSQPFRVGVVFDGPRAPRWVDSLIAFLKELPGIEVCQVTFGGPPSRDARPPWLVDRLYSVSRQKFDPLSEVDRKNGESGGDRTETLDSIRARGCGVIIWLSSGGGRMNLAGLAEHGVLTVRFGKRPGPLPFWDEVAAGEPTSTATVYWHDSSLDGGRMIRKVETSTVQGLYFTMNAGEPFAAITQTLAGLCYEIKQDGPASEERFRRIGEEPAAPRGPGSYPSTFQAGRFIARKLSRSAALRWQSRGRDPKWFVAVRPNAGRSIVDPDSNALNGFREIPLPPGSDYLADPFLIEVDGRTWLFVEEVPSGVSRGRLSCMELLDDGSCSGMTVVMEQDYHLSYPCVIPENGELFLLPESGAARQINLYRFTRFPAETELVATLLDGLVAVDTTPIFLNDRWYFFTTTVRPFMETLLFSSNRLDGIWTLHPSNPVSTSVINSRSAGHLFWENGRLFRPTQDCSIRYGYAITLNEVTRLTPTEFEEHPVAHVPPKWMPGLLGTHTWNQSSAFQVIDGLRFSS